MDNKIIISILNEWMMVEDEVDANDRFLLNVVSRERIQLPSLGDFDISCCAFSSPSDADCHIVFSGDEGILFCKPGGDEYQRQDHQVEDSPTHIISNGRKIYGIIGKIVVAFEFEESRLWLRPILEGSRIPSPPPAHIRCTKRFMIQSQSCDDELLIVVRQGIGMFGFEVSKFTIYKANLTRGEGWIKMDGIGTRTIFLNDWDEGFCCSTTDPAIKKNSIYYLSEDDTYIYVWDLEEQSVTMHLPSSDVDQQHTILYWIMLPGSMHKVV
ncbi:hypothetical protein Tsubulata_045825 [Turnera subulata]|uniref:KIB1-4 beta-propeller domain-containing protein n=1 Tax=Turnera subulata TaxID=218843 RepID=A0A9Q0IYA9_9ROSI|nr:hypothetical protein Tsubulata_045825 [Turnera subulata]